MNKTKRKPRVFRSYREYRMAYGGVPNVAEQPTPDASDLGQALAKEMARELQPVLEQRRRRHDTKTGGA